MDAIVGDSVVLENVEITLEKVYRAVSSLKRNKKEGVDGLNSTIFIECKSGVSLPLQKVFSSSIKNGDIPADWKMANVTPIFKKGSKKDMGNYRPVSLTCQACKICEKILKEEIVNFLEINNRLTNSQHGFRNKRSCLTNLLEFSERILEHVDGNEPVDVMFFDLQKAFDKVPHKRLLYKLYKIGIRGGVLEWIKEWLKDRKQRVVLNGEASSWIEVISGVSQGSVLGPVLFIIYINDIDENIVSRIRIFNDDTKMLGEVKTTDDRMAIKKYLNNFLEWADLWQMPFNI